MELDLDGAGDRRVQSISESDTPRYIKRKLANGLPIPVYIAPLVNRQSEEHDVFDDFTDTKWNRPTNITGQPKDPHLKSSVNLLKEYLRCSICSDPCIETTSTNCGHKFCRHCIDQWRKQKPICPVCSTLITSQHRLYSDDLFVESQLPYLRPDLKQRFKDAQRERLKILLEEQKSRNLIKSVRRKLDSSLIYLRCKSSGSIAKKITSTFRMCSSKLSEWSGHENFNLVLGIFIGVLFMIFSKYLGDNTQFLHYMWLAIRNYDGKIPEQWLPLRDAQPIQIVRNETGHFSRFIKTLAVPLDLLL